MPLSSQTPVSISVAGWASLCLTIGISGWTICSYARDYRDELKALSAEIRDINATRWTIADQERYNYQLERLNRERNLQVPQVGRVP